MAEEQQLPDVIVQENYRKEYDVISSSWRFFSGLRFIIVAFAATLESAPLTFYLQVGKQGGGDQLYLNGVAFAGIFITIALGILELRTISLFRLMIRRGVEVEFHLTLSNAHFS